MCWTYVLGKKAVMKVEGMYKDSKFKDFISFVFTIQNYCLKIEQYFNIAVVILITFPFF